MATYRSNHGVAVLHNLGFRPTGILDVGAYRGEWTQLVRHYYPEARFLMIEAQPKLESALKAVAAADPNRIEYRMALLGPEHRDAVDFFQMDIPITTGSSLYAEQTSFARSVAQLPMVRLDDVVGGGKLIAVLKARDFLLSDLYPVLRNRTGSLLQVDAVFLRRGSPFWAKPPFF